MDERLNRFQFCDGWLYPYLDRVLARLPENLREDMLNNKGFQIISDAAFPDICGQCLHFEQPVEYLIYLNPALVKQADVRLDCAIAMEIANYVAIKEGTGDDKRRIEALLMNWGFEKEVNSASFCNAIAQSKAFKSGYEWARKQSPDYLMLHFGIYYDEWNQKGLPRMSKDRIELLRDQFDTKRKLPTVATNEEKSLPDGISFDEVLIEGIMAAVKEMKLQRN
jgi:hypothetical protein